MLQNYQNLQIWNTSVFSPSVSPNFFTLFLDSFFWLLCFRFRLTRVSSIILFRARTLVVLRHSVLANWLVECFSLVVPNMVLSKLNIQKLVSKHTRGRYTFQPLWVSGKIKKKSFSFIFTESSFERINHRHCSLHQKMMVLDHVLRRLEVYCNLICHCVFIMNVVSHFKLPSWVPTNLIMMSQRSVSCVLLWTLVIPLHTLYQFSMAKS